MRAFAHTTLVAAALALLLAAAPARAQNTTPGVALAEAHAALAGSTEELKTSTAELVRLEEEKVAAESAKLEQLRQLYTEGLYAKNALDQSEAALAASRAHLESLRLKMADTERQIAQARADEVAAKTRTNAGLVSLSTRTTSTVKFSPSAAMIRYTGKSSWTVANLDGVRAFFSSTFGRALPVSALGQSATHDRYGYDHRNAVDVALHPDSAEGRALINYLQTQGIAFSAFRTAIPGVATGPHIHIGRPSGRVG